MASRRSSGEAVVNDAQVSSQDLHARFAQADHMCRPVSRSSSTNTRAEHARGRSLPRRLQRATAGVGGGALIHTLRAVALLPQTKYVERIAVSVGRLAGRCTLRARWSKPEVPGWVGWRRKKQPFGEPTESRDDHAHETVGTLRRSRDATASCGKELDRVERGRGSDACRADGGDDS